MSEITVEEKTWTTDWPTEPGWYWFYGWTYGFVGDHTPGLYSVNVFESSNEVIVRVIDGNFMYESEGHQGIFSPMEDPTLPAWADVESMAVG